jgi:hypothetical protein
LLSWLTSKPLARVAADRWPTLPPIIVGMRSAWITRAQPASQSAQIIGDVGIAEFA